MTDESLSVARILLAVVFTVEIGGISVLLNPTHRWPDLLDPPARRAS